mgnify:CR=1 FL=1|jgi:hypothetical protein|tara:strand:- start:443 stop:817 length:375 start_codon:yes stop_codon:yes gene_type:complete
MKKNRTIFCDIDGTIFKYRKFETYKTTNPELTPGALEKIKQWKQQDCMIILTTARPEEYRTHTIRELALHEVPWDRLIMGIERGPRYLINDMDPAKPGLRAIAHNLIRDEGMKTLTIGETEEVI